MAVIGDLIIQLSADMASFRSSMEEAKGNLAGVQGAAESAAGSLGILTKAAEGLVAAITVKEIASWAENTAAAGAEIEHVAERVGLSVSAYQTFGLAAKQAGIDQDTFNRTLSIFSRNIGEVAQGGGENAAKALASLGVSIRDVNGNLLPMQDIFTSFLDKLAKVKDAAIANADAYAVAGRGAAGLSNLAKELADGGFEKIRAKAEELGMVLSDQTAAAAAKTHDDFVQLSQVVENQMISGLVALSPEIAKVTNALTEMAAEWGASFGFLTTPAQKTSQIAQLKQDLADLQPQAEALAGQLDAIMSGATGHVAQQSRARAVLAEMDQVEGRIATVKAQLAELQAPAPAEAHATPGPPVVDPQAAKQAGNFKTSYDELLTSLSEGKAAQDSLRESYQQGSQAVEDARVRTAGLAAVQKVLNDATREHIQVSAQELQIVQEAAEAQERSKIAASEQKSATDGMASAAKQQYDALLPLGNATDGLSAKQVALANSIGKVWEAYDLGIIKTLPEAEAQIKQLQTAFEDTTQSSKEIVSAVERGASGFLDAFVQLPFAIGKADEAEERLNRRHQQLSAGAQIVQQLGKSFEGLAQDILKAVAQAEILQPILASLGIENGKMTGSGLLGGGLSGLAGAAGGFFGHLFGGGATSSGLQVPLDIPDFAGFATGGSFDVGGSGGTDSQKVGFMATPGEHVSINPPGTSANGGPMSVVINNNHSSADVSTQQADDGNGGRSLIVQVDEALAYGVGIGKSQLGTVLTQTGIGNARTPIAR